MKNRLLRMVLLLSLALLLFQCQQNYNAVQAPGGEQSLQLSLKFLSTTGTTVQIGNVNAVTVEIDGEGLDNPIRRDLTISGGVASGEFTVPVGQKDIIVTGQVRKGSTRIDLFQGSKSLNVTPDVGTIDINLFPVQGNDIEVAWHDFAAEDFIWSDIIGAVFASGFSFTQPFFISQVDFFLRWQGADGPYRIVIYDANFNLLFRSGQPLSPQADGWISWELLWSDPAAGLISSGQTVYVGLEYETDAGYPEIGYDMSNPSTNSFFYDPNAQGWFFLNDGDFLITTTVLVQGGAGMEEHYLTPKGVFKNKSEFEAWKRMQVVRGEK